MWRPWVVGRLRRVGVDILVRSGKIYVYMGIPA